MVCATIFFISDAVDVAFDEAIDIISSEAERDLAQSSLQVR